MMELNNTRKTNLSRLLTCLFIILLTILLASCNKKKQDIDEPNNNITKDNTVFPEEMRSVLYNKKVYITSIGQSSDMSEYKEVVLDNIDYLDYTMDSLLKPSSVEKGGVVLLFVGCSIKALAASELTIDDELSRASEYVKMSKDKDITLICIHIGGASRRGATSDQFINALFPNSNMNIYLDKGNSDNLLSDLSNNNKVPCYEISSTLMLSRATELLYSKDN